MDTAEEKYEVEFHHQCLLCNGGLENIEPLPTRMVEVIKDSNDVIKDWRDMPNYAYWHKIISDALKPIPHKCENRGGLSYGHATYIGCTIAEVKEGR